MGTGFLTDPPAQPNVHQGVAALSQSNRMLRTVQGAPPTDRAVRESTRYFTVLRPPSRSTLNCSWEGKGERACTQGCVAVPSSTTAVSRRADALIWQGAGWWSLCHRSAWESAPTAEPLPCSPPAQALRSRLAHGTQVLMAAPRVGTALGQAGEDRAIWAQGELGGKAWPCCFPHVTTYASPIRGPVSTCF